MRRRTPGTPSAPSCGLLPTFPLPAHDLLVNAPTAVVQGQSSQPIKAIIRPLLVSCLRSMGHDHNPAPSVSRAFGRHGSRLFSHIFLLPTCIQGDHPRPKNQRTVPFSSLISGLSTTQDTSTLYIFLVPKSLRTLGPHIPFRSCLGQHRHTARFGILLNPFYSSAEPTIPLPPSLMPHDSTCQLLLYHPRHATCASWLQMGPAFAAAEIRSGP